MDGVDVAWHLAGLVAVAAWTGVLATTGAWWLWWGPGAARRWRRLAVWTTAAGCATAVAGLLWLGHDGRMLTYAAIVIACALTLWWQARGRRP